MNNFNKEIKEFNALKGKKFARYLDKNTNIYIQINHNITANDTGKKIIIDTGNMTFEKSSAYMNFNDKYDGKIFAKVIAIYFSDSSSLKLFGEKE